METATCPPFGRATGGRSFLSSRINSGYAGRPGWHSTAADVAAVQPGRQTLEFKGRCLARPLTCTGVKR